MFGKFKKKKETLLFVLAPTILVGLTIWGGNRFGFDPMTPLLIFELVIVSIFLLSFIILANAAVMKSLFHISAGLSLIIFIAQSYCDVQIRTDEGNSALRLLILFGIVYILFDFAETLRTALKEYLEEMPEKGSLTHYAITGLILFFVLCLLIMICRVITPIFFDLCVLS